MLLVLSLSFYCSFCTGSCISLLRIIVVMLANHGIYELVINRESQLWQIMESAFLDRAIVAGHYCICIILHGQSCVSNNTSRTDQFPFVSVVSLFFLILRYIERKIKKIYLRSFIFWNCVVFYFYIQLFFVSQTIL